MLPSVFEQLGWLSIALPLFGLFASFKLRKYSWSIVIWAPTTAVLFYFLFETVRFAFSLGGVGGPDAIGVGFMFMAQILAISLQSIALFLCYKAKPHSSRHGTFLLFPSLLIACFAVFAAGDRIGIVMVNLMLVDRNGDPIRHSEANTVHYDQGIGTSRETGRTTADGTLSFRLRKTQFTETQIKPRSHSTGYDANTPTYWTLSLSIDENASIVARHSWQRSIGNLTLNEGFVQLFPATRSLKTTVSIPSKRGIDQPMLREQITDSIRRFSNYPSERYDYAYLCGNVEAIESMQWLMELYRSVPKSRSSIAKGLERIADIAGDLDRALTYLESYVQKYGGFESGRVPISKIEDTQEFIKWAGYAGVDLDKGLSAARSKLQSIISQLMAFVSEEIKNANELSSVIGNLKRTSIPVYDHFIKTIAESPPRTVSFARRWAHDLYLTREKNSSSLAYTSLLQSSDPLVLLVALEHAKSNRDIVHHTIAKNRLLSLMPEIEDSTLAEELERVLH